MSDPQPIRVPLDDVESIWLCASRTAEWWPRTVILFSDGTYLCSCKRRDKGCHHAHEAEDARAEAFARYENLAEAVIDERRAAVL